MREWDEDEIEIQYCFTFHMLWSSSDAPFSHSFFSLHSSLDSVRGPVFLLR